MEIFDFENVAGADPEFCLRGGGSARKKGHVGGLEGLPQEIFKKLCDLVHFQSALTPLKGAPYQETIEKKATLRYILPQKAFF